MNREIATIVLSLTVFGLSAQSIDECQKAAARNYPLIRRYELIARSADFTVANIGKSWLPQVSATAQATWQNKVATLPDALTAMMAGQGRAPEGLRKDQYKIGIDISQTLYDGGDSRARRDVARWQGSVEQAQNEVDLYAVGRRVNELYFGILLTDDQLQLNRNLQELLLADERKLAAMLKSGTAAESDCHSVHAERLRAVQQAVELESRRTALQRMLAAFTGWDSVRVERPAELQASDGNNRPELQLAEYRLHLADMQERTLDAALKPRLSLFAQGWYGSPGLDMFHDMMTRSWSLNGLVGVRLSWNIGALYTRRNDKARIDLTRRQAEIDREVFLFNNRLERLQQDENISQYRRLKAADDEIIALREAVRRAAESKLAHGIIDTDALVKEINSENEARLQRSIHEIEMLKEMYDMKFTLNQQNNEEWK